MRRKSFAGLAALAGALALSGAGAFASMMHSQLTAHLSGMGEHGTVELQVTSTTGKVCWTFNMPSVTATGASVHTGQNGTKLFELGMHYSQHGCMTESAMTLEHLEAAPGKYWVWVDTKGHMGELRGQLAAM
jgi:CHRD domain